jgi:ferredoxin-NADP reductase/MOSC domain-containing protein YiiM/ferredoxin
MSERVATLASVNVGMPRDVDWQGRTVHTGIWKHAVEGPCRVGRLNVHGDGQGDLAGHGGEQRAVYVYQLDSYRHWREQLGRDDFVFGQFGENFTVDGLGDDEVCIGDRYRIGTALFEVTQPRVTCYRLGIRMSEPRMPALLVGHGRPGFYLRVLEEGAVQAGDDVVRVATGPERMTVETVSSLLYLDGHHDPEQLRRALRIPALSPGWQGSFRALLDDRLSGVPGGGNAGLTATGPPPGWSGFRPLRVAAKRSETTSVISLELDADDGLPLAPALPGQFVTLRLEPGGGAPPLVRSYSLSGPADGARYRISIKVEPHGAAGGHVRDAVEVGDRIDVAAPRGRFTLDDGARPVALVSAGVGVTPVLAMLHALSGGRATREVWWLHGARNGAEHAFVQEARSLLASLPQARSRVWYSRPDPSDRVGVDHDEVGHITADALAATGVPTDSEFYLCGPPAFMDTLRAGLDALGVSPARVHTEAFGAEGSITPGVVAQAARPAHPPDARTGTGPLVSFVRTGLNVRWDDAFTSILDLAEACDVPVRWSCRTGVCHTCETGLLDGAVAYDPEPLEPPGEGNVLVCCSRPGGNLAVDL